MPKSVTVYRVTKKGNLKKIGKCPCPADDLMPPTRRTRKYKGSNAKTPLLPTS